MELFHDENNYPHKAGKSVSKDHFMSRKHTISAFNFFFHEMRNRAKRSGMSDLTPGSLNYDRLVKHAKKKWHNLDSKTKSRYGMKAKMDHEQKLDTRDVPDNKDLIFFSEHSDNNKRRRVSDDFSSSHKIQEPLNATDPVFISLDNIPRSPELVQWARSFIEQNEPFDDTSQNFSPLSKPELFEWADSFLQDHGSINDDVPYRYDKVTSSRPPSRPSNQAQSYSI